MNKESKYKDSGNQVTIDWKANGIPEFDPSLVPSFSIGQEIVNQFKSEGAVLIRGVFRDWVERLQRGLQKNLDAPDQYAFPCESTPEGAPGRFFDSYCNWLLIPEYLDYVKHSCAASIAGQLMESEQAQFFHEHAFCKEPGTQRATPWHQDMPYYCVDGSQTVSLYVALDHSPADVTVRFVRGSHRWERLFHPVDFLDGADFQSEGESLESVPDIDRNPEKYDILAWDLEPGDCVAFNFLTLHGTTAGEVQSRRRAVSTRWLGDDVTFFERTVETSPPFPDINLEPGERMRTDWFPILWQRS